jgi:exodeoxyribonuclease VII large subunit
MRRAMSTAAMPLPSRSPEQALTVSQLTEQIRDLLEAEFVSLWVVGEISNYKRHPSGHTYFTLKDDRAQIAAVIWRSTPLRMPFELHDGLSVIVRGRVRVFEAAGRYQLQIDYLQPKGLGPLQLAFRQLQAKLEAEGLFDRRRKRPLPRFPRRVVLVTSPSGAAIRDMIKVIGGRWPLVETWVRAVPTQGADAAREIAAAIAEVNRLRGIDVLIVGRGGGSLEDLWPFNEEVLARAIAASRIPIISAVGHEVDVTIADLVADVRAATPSNAGELVVPDRQEIRGQLAQFATRLRGRLNGQVDAARRHFDQLARRRPFRFPLDAILDRQERCDAAADRLHRAMQNRLRDAAIRVDGSAKLLERLSPARQLQARRDQLQQLADRLAAACTRRLAEARTRVEQVQERRCFRDPLDRITVGHERCAGFPERFLVAWQAHRRVARQRLDQLGHRPCFQAPLSLVEAGRGRAAELGRRLARIMENRLREGRHQVARASAALQGLSPLRVLARGYSLTTCEDGLTVVRAPGDVAAGDRILTRLAEGQIVSRVE